jgi:U3 small nucleolar RNA-associated protein 22
LYKPPTAAELREFRQGDDLFKSNLFRLQLTELLTEVRLKDAKTAQVDAGLHALKKALAGLASATEAVEVDRTTVFKGGVKPPLAITPEAATLIRYQFVKPSKVAVVGSYLLKVSTVSGVGTHVCVCAFLFSSRRWPLDLLARRAAAFTHHSIVMTKIDRGVTPDESFISKKS